MRRIMTWCAGLALVGALAGCGQSPAASSGGRAIEVPGPGALNNGAGRDFIAGVSSVSCASAGSCAAGGDYQDGDRHEQGFVAVEKHGVWGRAIEVPGLGALNKGGNAGVVSVSCASPGNCAAGGYYTAGDAGQPGFVVSEKNGRWGQAVEVPGLAALNQGRQTSDSVGVVSVSCASPGNCAAGGDYEDRAGNGQGFVAAERNGVWGQAIEVPGLGALNKGWGGDASVSSVSCASPGNCVAGGTYAGGRGQGYEGFVASERHGVWDQAIEVPGLRALNTFMNGGVDTVSCASAGNCAAGGSYEDRGQNGQGFVVGEKNGVWGKAIDPPGLRALNDSSGSPNAGVDSVSCASAGNCAAVGTYGDPYGTGFVVAETKGVWGRAADVGLVGGRIAGANSVSCASAGNCAAGGFYSDATGGVTQGWVAVERNGRWDNGSEVPGLGTLNEGGGAEIDSVSCAPAGTCAAVGSYTDRRGHSQGFVVNPAGQGR